MPQGAGGNQPGEGGPKYAKSQKASGSARSALELSEHPKYEEYRGREGEKTVWSGRYS